jgi:molybdenum cofactor synthesis domain-containing protein
VDPLLIAILTVSDGVAAGTREDRSGAAVARWCAGDRRVLVRHETVADDAVAVIRALLEFVDALAVDLVITTGGTGFTARDITPEATQAVIERAAPGIAEAVRAHGVAATPFASLSRGIAGIRGRTLIVNLPGSEGGVRDGLAVLDDVAEHAVQLLRGIETDRHRTDPAARAIAHG